MEANRLVTTFATLRKASVYSVKVTSDGNLLIGGQDGNLGVWDAIQDKKIEDIDVKAVLQQSEELVKRDATAPKWDHNTTLYISQIDISRDNWWTVCGGTQSPQSGFLATWYAPTRSLLTATITRETPQHMAKADRCLLTAANDGFVSHWNPTQLQRIGRLGCSSPCSYAVAIRSQDGCTAVAGVGSQVDIFRNLEDRAFSLSLYDPREHK